ncbi:hypothetical protein RHSIM_Rhsim05G0055100 [Rhododendron simsii]|uniref:Uncharacterized protein n=1 Tax=Rhododendron simsii TaxID=118357 RepID=A0A834H1I9_RHOSS|nr:hypothetical protein RHSIM_Rhsim05G0055100 [Rhododendron simsii]
MKPHAIDLEAEPSSENDPRKTSAAKLPPRIPSRLTKRAMPMGVFAERYANLATLPLHDSAFQSLGIKAHSSVHQSFVPPVRSFEFRGSGRCELGHSGMPIFLEDDETELMWPGSFRRHLIANSLVNFSEATPAAEIDERAPDLTLRL